MTADKREALLGFVRPSVRANCATACLRLLRLEENTMFRIDDFRCSYPNNNPYGLGIDFEHSVCYNTILEYGKLCHFAASMIKLGKYRCLQESMT